MTHTIHQVGEEIIIESTIGQEHFFTPVVEIRLDDPLFRVSNGRYMFPSYAPSEDVFVVNGRLFEGSQSYDTMDEAKRVIRRAQETEFPAVDFGALIQR